MRAAWRGRPSVYTSHRLPHGPVLAPRPAEHQGRGTGWRTALPQTAPPRPRPRPSRPLYLQLRHGAQDVGHAPRVVRQQRLHKPCRERVDTAGATAAAAAAAAAGWGCSRCHRQLEVAADGLQVAPPNLAERVEHQRPGGGVPVAPGDGQRGARQVPSLKAFWGPLTAKLRNVQGRSDPRRSLLPTQSTKSASSTTQARACPAANKPQAASSHPSPFSLTARPRHARPPAARIHAPWPLPL